MNKISELSQQYAEELVAFRRDLHQHPELGGQETRTAGLLAAELTKLGIEVKAGIAKTGIQGMLWGKNPKGKTILIRADMDALPMEELNDLSYRSQTENVMHACGHDIHTAAVLGAAKILSQLRDSLDGNVKFCFQPAEESVGGADLMVKEGIMEQPHVDYAIGMHVDPTHPVGTVAVEAGPVTAYPDFFEIVFTGKGGHGSFPSKSNDPILPAVDAYRMIQSIAKRVSPLEPCVIQICMFQAGSGKAIIPDTALLGGTVRTLHAHNRELVKTQMEAICRHIAELYGVTYTLEYRGHCSPVYNTPELVGKVRESVAPLFDGGFVTNENMKIGGEDFCYYCKYAPATFLMVGSANQEPSTQYALHNPHFNVDERVIAKGAAAFAQIAVDYLSGKYE